MDKRGSVIMHGRFFYLLSRNSSCSFKRLSILEVRNMVELWRSLNEILLHKC